MTMLARKRDRGVQLNQTDALLRAVVPLNAGTDSAVAIARSMEFLSELAGVVPAEAVPA
jgi:hypothetical protein